MLRIRRSLIRLVYLCIDLLCVIGALYVTCILRTSRFDFDITLYNLFINSDNPFRYVFIIWSVATVLALTSRALYETKRELFQGFEMALVFRAVGYSTIATILTTYLFKIHGFPRSVLLAGTVLLLVFLCVWRFIKRSFVSYLVAKKGYNNFNAIIIGAGREGHMLLSEIQSNPALGINIVGFLDDDKELKDTKLSVLGSVKDLEKVVRRNFITKVFVSAHLHSKDFSQLLDDAKKAGAAVLVIPEGYRQSTGGFTKYNIDTIPVLEYCVEAPFRLQIGKRIFDLALTIPGVIVFSPFFFLIALIVKLDSKGPLFHSSQRYGKSGKVFTMYKFRSMYADAEERLEEIKHQNEIDGPIFKIKNDPRITRVGKWIRKYSLDELPQVINVIKGDMSLVGPRPFLVEHVEREDLKQWRRLEVRPGITGLWQIKGRNDVEFGKLLKLDSWYIDNWSYWLDIVILIQTFPAIVKAKGAY